MAAAWGGIRAVMWMSGNGVDVGAKDHVGRTAMHYSGEAGDGDVLHWLVTNGGLDLEETDAEGSTPGHVALAAWIGPHGSALWRGYETTREREAWLFFLMAYRRLGGSLLTREGRGRDMAMLAAESGWTEAIEWIKQERKREKKTLGRAVSGAGKEGLYESSTFQAFKALNGVIPGTGSEEESYDEEFEEDYEQDTTFEEESSNVPNKKGSKTLTHTKESKQVALYAPEKWLLKGYPDTLQDVDDLLSAGLKLTAIIAISPGAWADVGKWSGVCKEYMSRVADIEKKHPVWNLPPTEALEALKAHGPFLDMGQTGALCILKPPVAACMEQADVVEKSLSREYGFKLLEKSRLEAEGHTGPSLSNGIMRHVLGVSQERRGEKEGRWNGDLNEASDDVVWLNEDIVEAESPQVMKESTPKPNPLIISPPEPEIPRLETPEPSVRLPEELLHAVQETIVRGLRPPPPWEVMPTFNEIGENAYDILANAIMSTADRHTQDQSLALVEFETFLMGTPYDHFLKWFTFPLIIDGHYTCRFNIYDADGSGTIEMEELIDPAKDYLAECRAKATPEDDYDERRADASVRNARYWLQLEHERRERVIQRFYKNRERKRQEILVCNEEGKRTADAAQELYNAVDAKKETFRNLIPNPYPLTPNP